MLHWEPVRCASCIHLTRTRLPNTQHDADVQLFILHSLRLNFETCLDYTLSPGVRAPNNSTIVIIFLCRQSCVQKPLLITTELMDRRRAKKGIKRGLRNAHIILLLRAG